MSLRPTELFALSQGSLCQGNGECHWCCAPCGQDWTHDDPVVLFQRTPAHVLRPNNSYICTGCWLWRRKRVTIPFLSGGFRDLQCALNYSWLVTEEEAKAIEFPDDYQELFHFLIKPHPPFFLSLLDGLSQQNHPQMGVVNEDPVLQLNSPLHFTINNIRHSYTVYELKEAMANGAPGKMPGVRALVQIFRNKEVEFEEKESKRRGRGRPPKMEDGLSIRKTIYASGVTE